MVNLSKKLESQLNKLKRLIDTSSSQEKLESYGNYWQNKDKEFYEAIYYETPKIHEYFQEWYSRQGDINTILDVGCGAGIYGRRVFKDKSYHGVDISGKAIALAQSKDRNKNHSYRICDFIADKYYNDAHYDLVFSLSVIDHVYNPDEFIKKCVKLSKRHAWIAAYWGYFPKLKLHKMEWHPEITCYQNKLSVSHLQNLLDNLNVKYSIEALPYEKRKKPAVATIIKIEKT